MTDIQPHEFTAEETTGEAYTRDFIKKFLPGWTGQKVWAASMKELIEMYQDELDKAKQRWPRLDTAATWADMDHWLSERGYVEPQYRED